MSKLSRFVSAGVSAYLSVLTKVDASAYLLAQVIVGTSAGNDGYQYLPLSKLRKVCTSLQASQAPPTPALSAQFWQRDRPYLGPILHFCAKLYL